MNNNIALVKKEVMLCKKRYKLDFENCRWAVVQAHTVHKVGPDVVQSCCKGDKEDIDKKKRERSK